MSKIILCVPDGNLLRSLKTWLGESGYETTGFGSAVEAVTETFARMPRLAVVELRQLDVEGLAAARRIHERFAIPIIVIADTCSQENLRRAAEVGVRALLTKPLREQEILAALGLSLDEARRVQALKDEVRALKESIERRKMVEQAKGMLMERDGLTEAEAFRKIQKLAMDRRIPMRRMAETLLLADRSGSTNRINTGRWNSPPEAANFDRSS